MVKIWLGKVKDGQIIEGLIVQGKASKFDSKCNRELQMVSEE